MAGINKVILVGHLGKDPEVKKTNNDAKYARFTLATTENYKDKVSGEKKNPYNPNTVFYPSKSTVNSEECLALAQSNSSEQ